MAYMYASDNLTGTPQRRSHYLSLYYHYDNHVHLWYILCFCHKIIGPCILDWFIVVHKCIRGGQDCFKVVVGKTVNKNQCKMGLFSPFDVQKQKPPASSLIRGSAPGVRQGALPPDSCYGLGRHALVMYP